MCPYFKGSTVIQFGKLYNTGWKLHASFQVPVRWMALESLRNKVYTHKSDVWSFGITVWETLTFGARPYQSKSAKDLLKMLFKGERLEQPATATIELYAILLECES